MSTKIYQNTFCMLPYHNDIKYMCGKNVIYLKKMGRQSTHAPSLCTHITIYQFIVTFFQSTANDRKNARSGQLCNIN